MKTPHKHAELIKAWADGAEIEARQGVSNSWVFVREPTWSIHGVYRIKPEPKPDAVIHGYLYKTSWGMALNTKCIFANNIKITWDGETGKLKSSEVIS